MPCYRVHGTTTASSNIQYRISSSSFREINLVQGRTMIADYKFQRPIKTHQDTALKVHNSKWIIGIYMTLFTLTHFNEIIQISEHTRFLVAATSINYGISQQPITDTNQLMPKLCQNQSVICEGSFCIPGIRKCVCDLRMPVQFDRYCLRQVDIETKCFATSQCNHTVKDAVCIDINSNAILDAESSKFKLDQWQQLYELRQMSQPSLARDSKQQFYTSTMTTGSPQVSMLLLESDSQSLNFGARDDVIISNARNSPYEINYNTPELLLQNHTRRRTNSSDKSNTMNGLNFLQPTTVDPNRDTQLNKDTSSIVSVISDMTTSTTVRSTTITNTPSTLGVPRTTTTRSANFDSADLNTHKYDQYGGNSNFNSNNNQQISNSRDPQIAATTPTSTTTAAYSDLASRKKMIIKSPNWPPGVCSCPFGFMFDSMLRKCLALSLADSHCQVESDCKQVAATHCSSVSKKCECDEPLVWNQTELACVRPTKQPQVKTESSTPKKENGGGFVDYLLPPLILAKLLPDHSIMLLIFVIIVIIGTLILLKVTVKCFSSSNSALISPKNKKKKPAPNNLTPRSPYATLRRPDHKPSSQLSNFTQATRGRILNYDFEQEGQNVDVESHTHSPQPPPVSAGQKSKDSQPVSERVSTLKKAESASTKGSHSKTIDDDQLMELNDDISVSQIESESKASDNSVLAIPGPPPTQQPPYMLKSAMKGQGLAIAAAAAAVANKRMQLAQKKNLEQSSGKQAANGSPVFL